MNHKRKRPKNRRGGCLYCKPWKVNGVSIENNIGERGGDHRRRMAAIQDINQAWFWTPEWQAREREVDEHVLDGNFFIFDSLDEMFEALGLGE